MSLVTMNFFKSKNVFLWNKLNLNSNLRSIGSSVVQMSKRVPEEAIPKNLYDEIHNLSSQPNGKIYDKKPFKVTLEANKKYAWCSCGESKSQPFCDGTHKIETFKIKHKPVLVKVAETKEYWLCNCKQSLHKPFCDGTHLNKEIQEKKK